MKRYNTEGLFKVDFSYVPDDFRSKSVIEKLDESGQYQLEKTTYYAAGYEEDH